MSAAIEYVPRPGFSYAHPLHWPAASNLEAGPGCKPLTVTGVLVHEHRWTVAGPNDAATDHGDGVSAMTRIRTFIPAAAACLLTLPSWAADSGDRTSAVWSEKELTFVYQGFTTHYSCDGLRDKMRGVLLDLGADEKTLKITQLGCTSLAGRPDPFPGVKAKMRVLEAVAGTADDKAVPAHWQPVDLKLRNSYLTDSGECELVEQIRQRVLPLFAVRDVDLKTNCIPHQATATRPMLKLEVLAPDAASQHQEAEPQANR